MLRPGAAAPGPALNGSEALRVLADPNLAARAVRFTVTERVAACEVHGRHTPHTVVNERHHVFPQALQIALLGRVVYPETQVICATGHNTVHHGLAEALAGRPIPADVRNEERALVLRAIEMFQRAGGIVGRPKKR